MLSTYVAWWSRLNVHYYTYTLIINTLILFQNFKIKIFKKYIIKFNLYKKANDLFNKENDDLTVKLNNMSCSKCVVVSLEFLLNK